MFANLSRDDNVIAAARPEEEILQVVYGQQNR
jgi:hypothetical protein